MLASAGGACCVCVAWTPPCFGRSPEALSAPSLLSLQVNR
ncbi:hypothetical protein A4U88_3908 [Serratia marcescens]|nr:hypothetical protein A4U88_3908 [Serratia marcescens]